MTSIWLPDLDFVLAQDFTPNFLGSKKTQKPVLCYRNKIPVRRNPLVSTHGGARDHVPSPAIFADFEWIFAYVATGALVVTITAFTWFGGEETLGKRSKILPNAFRYNKNNLWWSVTIKVVSRSLYTPNSVEFIDFRDSRTLILARCPTTRVIPVVLFVMTNHPATSRFRLVCGFWI